MLLSHTDEEVERSFEDFYEDVHTEFLKFGELVNFKVCRNASSHLRGNVYVHYKSLESAVAAYQSINGRYFGGKQLSCEFVSLTRWKVAICGEYMKSRFKTCSRGSACNFIHCFRNPGGDYEWADWDNPAPRYWLKKMAFLFGDTGDRFTDEDRQGCYRSRRSRSGGLDSPQSSSRYYDDHKRRQARRYRGDSREKSRSTGLDSPQRSSRYDDGDDDDHKRRHPRGYKGDNREKSSAKVLDRPQRSSRYDNDDHKRRHPRRSRSDSSGNSSNLELDNREGEKTSQERHRMKCRKTGTDDVSNCSSDDQKSIGHKSGKSRKREREQRVNKQDSESRECETNLAYYDSTKRRELDSDFEPKARSSSKKKGDLHYLCSEKSNKYDVENSRHLDGHRDKYHGHKGKDSLQKRKEIDSSDTCRNSVDKEEDMHSGLGKKSLQIHSEVELSGSSSDGSRIRRDKKRPLKNKRSSSRTENNSSSGSRRGYLDRSEDSCYKPGELISRERKIISETANSGGMIDREAKRPLEKRRKSQSTEKQSGLTDNESDRNFHDLDGKAESEIEQEYRLAALKKLEEMRKCKDNVSILSRKIDENAESGSHDDIVVEATETGDDLQEFSGSGKGETSAGKRKRRRI